MHVCALSVAKFKDARLCASGTRLGRKNSRWSDQIRSSLAAPLTLAEVSSLGRQVVAVVRHDRPFHVSRKAILVRDTRHLLELRVRHR